MTTDAPLVVVAGASGYLGGHVVIALKKRGARVRALVRNPKKLRFLQQYVDDIHVADLRDPAAIGDAFDGAQLAFSSVGKRDFGRKPTTLEVDYGANQNLIAPAKSAGIERFGFVSVLHGPALAEAGIKTAQHRERIVTELREAGLAPVVVRPTGFFNDMADFFRMARRGTGWVLGDGNLKLNPIDGADLAEFLVERLLDPAFADTAHDVGGPEVFTYREILELAFAVQGRPLKLRHLPPWLLSVAAPAVGFVNPFVGDMLRSFAFMTDHDAVGPKTGTRTLRAHFDLLYGPDVKP